MKITIEIECDSVGEAYQHLTCLRRQIRIIWKAKIGVTRNGILSKAH